MNGIKAFMQYIELMATQHVLVKHSDKECHFACNVDESQNSFARRMCYPCISIDSGDFQMSYRDGNAVKSRDFTIIFATHVKDTADSKEINKAFDVCETIADDFIVKIFNDSNLKDYRFLARFDLDGIRGERIQLESPALYGWAIQMTYSEKLCLINQNDRFAVGDHFDEHHTETYD